MEIRKLLIIGCSIAAFTLSGCIDLESLGGGGGENDGPDDTVYTLPVDDNYSSPGEASLGLEYGPSERWMSADLESGKKYVVTLNLGAGGYGSAELRVCGGDEGNGQCRSGDLGSVTVDTSTGSAVGEVEFIATEMVYFSVFALEKVYFEIKLTPPAATNISVDTGLSLQQTADNSYGIVMFQFPATQGSTYNVTLDLSSGATGSAYLYICSDRRCENYTSVTTETGHVDSTSEAWADTLSFEASTTGQLYIGVVPESAITFQLGVSTGSPAAKVTVGTELTGLALTADGELAFEFTPATAGDHTLFIFDSANTSATWMIDGDGSVATGNTRTFNTVAALTENFTLSTSSSDAVSSFKLIVVEGDGGEGSTTAPLAINSGTVRSFSPQAGGYYAFSVTTNGTYMIKADPGTSALALQYRISTDMSHTTGIIMVGDTLGGTMASQNCDRVYGTSGYVGASGQVTGCNAVLTAGTTYYLWVRDYNGISDDDWGSATITIQ